MLTRGNPNPWQAWPRCCQKFIPYHHAATVAVTIWKAPVLPLILFGDRGRICYPKIATVVFLILDVLLETCHTPSSVGSIQHLLELEYAYDLSDPWNKEEVTLCDFQGWCNCRTCLPTGAFSLRGLCWGNQPLHHEKVQTSLYGMIMWRGQHGEEQSPTFPNQQNR